MEFKFDFERNQENLKILQETIEENKDKKGALMPILHKAQKLFGYLPIEVQTIISEQLNIPLSEIYGVATFYAQFSLIPKGKYEIGVCLGTACYVKGSQEILDKIKEDLKVEVGGTTRDRRFSLQATRCIGACGLAPVMTINEDVYGKLDPSEIDSILGKYKG
ncbi:NADH-quinone oxidoreductase subunit NuoE [Dethiothermospora halolimnae]|uniref:NADH-quinone oxidoreductase subunit NuoE n=1 Tax=Dethiothermospora halolimnae TaxID=3114390 RepID=UPI003CCB7CD0